MLGDYPRERVAVICYAAVMTLSGLSFSWMRYYSFFIAGLSREGIDEKLVRKAMIKSALNPVLHVVAIALAFVNTSLAIALLVAIPVMFFFPSRLEKTGQG